MTGAKKKTVWGWIRSGKLRAYRPSGYNYLIKESDLIAFIESGDTTKSG